MRYGVTVEQSQKKKKKKRTPVVKLHVQDEINNVSLLCVYELGIESKLAILCNLNVVSRLTKNSGQTGKCQCECSRKHFFCSSSSGDQNQKEMEKKKN